MDAKTIGQEFMGGKTVSKHLALINRALINFKGKKVNFGRDHINLVTKVNITNSGAK